MKCKTLFSVFDSDRSLCYGLASVCESRPAVLKTCSLEHWLIHFLNNQFIEQLSCTELDHINYIQYYIDYSWELKISVFLQGLLI